MFNTTLSLSINKYQSSELRISARPKKKKKSLFYTYQQISYMFINCVETYLMQLLLHIKALTKKKTFVVCKIMDAAVHWQNKCTSFLYKVHNFLQAYLWYSLHQLLRCCNNPVICVISLAGLHRRFVPFTTYSFHDHLYTSPSTTLINTLSWVTLPQHSECTLMIKAVL